MIKLYLIILLIALLICCKYSANSPSTESSINNMQIDMCGIDSILINSEFPHNYKDTIQIINNYKKILADSTINKIVKNRPNNNLYNHSFYKLNDKHIIILIDDEDEVVSASIYVIKNCTLLSKMFVAETTAWEHGKDEIKSIIENDSLIVTIKYSASRDWGDYTQWKYDTVISKYAIRETGEIFEDK